jgi:hypothetical protein
VRSLLLTSVVADPPLDPTGGDARSALRRELLRPEYNDQNVVQRVIDWFERRLGGLIDATSTSPVISTLLAMVILVVLVLGLALLVSRVRRTARVAARRRAVLTDEVVTAGELRTRAQAALAAGRFEDAVVDGFRALAVRQVERGRLADSPGATAHEVAASLASEYPDHDSRVSAAAVLFEQVLYGGRPADRAQADSVLRLDDDLAVRR